MGEHRRKADGRRVFTTEFKRATVQRIVGGEKTVAELSRELGIAPSVIRNWKRFADGGATTAVQASEDVALSTRGRRDRLAADPRRDEQPRDVRLSPRLGDGESHLPDRLQPQTHS